MTDLDRLLTSWEDIADRAGPLTSPTVSVTRSALKELLAAVRIATDRKEPT